MAIVLLVAAMLPGVFTALVAVQDGTDQLSYYISTSHAKSLHDQLSHAPGGFAWDYLRGDQYSSVKVEWASFDPQVLDGRTLPFSSFETLVFGHCAKSSISYTFVGAIDPSLQRRIYSEDDLNSISSAVFMNSSAEGVAIVHILFLSGSFTDPAAIGLSFAADRFAIFSDTLIDTYLRVSIAHEMGHLLGLVAPLGLGSRYTPANASLHYDAKDPPHCTSNPCLMRPVVSSYDGTCSFCNADMMEIKNTTAPYTMDQKQPSPRLGLIAAGSAATLLLAIPAAILFRRNGGD